MLSVLDLATVASGASEAEAVNRSVAVAEHAERLGYARFWTAEHHSMATIASSAPDLIALRVADRTSTIRVGSGGVMLPNHSPLQVAERFLTLEAFHPGRVDLGVGRAPGADPATAAALRRADASSYPQQLAELDAYLDGSARIQAVPRGGSRPPLYLLGSSLASARLAAARGDAFAFAGHFAADLAVPAMRLYREQFTPGTLARPHAILAASVVVADSAERAEWIAGSQRLAGLDLARGVSGPLPGPEVAAARAWSERERAVVAQMTGSLVVGDQGAVHGRLQELVEATGADELMVTSTVHGYEDHVRGLELLAEAFGVQGRSVASVGSGE